jgi:hypothetical protein
MARQIINIGAIGRDRTGDTIRNAFKKTNDNFNELYTMSSTNIGYTGSRGITGYTGSSAGSSNIVITNPYLTRAASVSPNLNEITRIETVRYRGSKFIQYDRPMPDVIPVITTIDLVHQYVFTDDDLTLGENELGTFVFPTSSGNPPWEENGDELYHFIDTHQNSYIEMTFDNGATWHRVESSGASSIPPSVSFSVQGPLFVVRNT